MKSYVNISFIIIVLILLCGNSHSIPLNDLVKKYNILNEKLVYDKERDSIVSRGEIQTNQQILIIPTKEAICSEDKYQFHEYFAKNNKEKIIGRLLIEKVLGTQGYYYEFIESLPQPKDMKDYYHYSESNIQQFNKRVFNQSSTPYENRKEAYENIVKKITTNTITAAVLNWELYNWASSIISCYAIELKKIYYNDVRKVMKYTSGYTDEICLVPGLNIFKKGKFPNVIGNNLSSNLYVYKDNIYLNSDRFIDEKTEVFNEIQFTSNPQLFDTCGIFIEDYLHEELKVKISNNAWTINKYNLCKQLQCYNDNNQASIFNFKNSFNEQFFMYCQIDQMTEKDDMKYAYKQIMNMKMISKENYIKSLGKGIEFLKNYIKVNKKTKMIEDIQDYQTVSNPIDKTIIKYAMSQKRIMMNQIKYFNDKIIHHFNEEIFGSIKAKFL